MVKARDCSLGWSGVRAGLMLLSQAEQSPWVMRIGSSLAELLMMSGLSMKEERQSTELVEAVVLQPSAGVSAAAGVKCTFCCCP